MEGRGAKWGGVGGRCSRGGWGKERRLFSIFFFKQGQTPNREDERGWCSVPPVTCRSGKGSKAMMSRCALILWKILLWFLLLTVSLDYGDNQEQKLSFKFIFFFSFLLHLLGLSKGFL